MDRGVAQTKCGNSFGRRCERERKQTDFGRDEGPRLSRAHGPKDTERGVVGGEERRYAAFKFIQRSEYRGDLGTIT